jgi:hypothetical protein
MRSSCDRKKATAKMSPKGFNGSADKLQDKISRRQSFQHAQKPGCDYLVATRSQHVRNCIAEW